MGKQDASFYRTTPARASTLSRYRNHFRCAFWSVTTVSQRRQSMRQGQGGDCPTAADTRPVFLVFAPERGFSRANYDSPYYRLKRLLLEAGYPSQMVKEDTLEHPEWKDYNFALDVFAKSGFVPWVLSEGMPNADLLSVSHQVSLPIRASDGASLALPMCLTTLVDGCSTREPAQRCRMRIAMLCSPHSLARLPETIKPNDASSNGCISTIAPSCGTRISIRLPKAS